MPINPRILDAAAKLATANAVTRQQDEEQRVNDLAAKAVAQRIQTTQQQQAARSALPLVTNAVTPLRLNAAITGLQRTGSISPIRGVDPITAAATETVQAARPRLAGSLQTQWQQATREMDAIRNGIESPFTEAEKADPFTRQFLDTQIEDELNAWREQRRAGMTPDSVYIPKVNNVEENLKAREEAHQKAEQEAAERRNATRDYFINQSRTKQEKAAREEAAKEEEQFADTRGDAAEYIKAKNMMASGDYQDAFQYLSEEEREAIKQDVHAQVAAMGLEYAEAMEKERDLLYAAYDEAGKKAAEKFITDYEGSADAGKVRTVQEYNKVYGLEGDELTRRAFNPFDVKNTEVTRATIQDRIDEGYASIADRDLEKPSLDAAMNELSKQDKYREDPEKYIGLIDQKLEELRKLQYSNLWTAESRVKQDIWDLERERELLKGYAALKNAGDSADSYSIPDLGVRGLNLLKEEKQAYAILLETEGKESAEAFLDAMSRYVNERNVATYQGMMRFGFDAAPVPMAVGSAFLDVAAEPAKLLGTTNMIVKQLTGQEIDINDPWNSGNIVQQTVKDETNRKITEANGGQRTIWNEVYDLAMNIAENGTRMLTTHKILPSSGWSTALMAYGSMGSYYTDAAKQATNSTQDELFATAGLSAISEFLTEALSDAHFWNTLDMDLTGKSGWQKAAKIGWNTLVGSLSEASTETLNDEITNQVQNYILEDESRYNQDVQRNLRELLRTGEMTNLYAATQEAEKRAYQQHMQDLLHTFIFSGISGGIMDAGGAAINRYQQHRIEREARREEETTNAWASMIEGMTNRELERQQNERQQREQERQAEDERIRNMTPDEARAEAARQMREDEQRRLEEAGRNIGQVIEPRNFGGRNQYSAADLLNADKADQAGIAVALAPDGRILIGAANAAEYLQARGAAQEQARQQRAEAETNAQREQFAQDAQVMIQPGEDGSYDAEQMAVAERAKANGQSVAMAPDGTVLIGKYQASSYLQNHMQEAAAQIAARGQAKGRDRLSPSQVRHRTAQNESLWSLEEAQKRFEAWQQEHGNPQEAQQETEQQTQEAPQDWGYNAALQRWKEFQQGWRPVRENDGATGRRYNVRGFDQVREQAQARMQGTEAQTEATEETAQPVRPQEPMERVNEVGDQRTEAQQDEAPFDEGPGTNTTQEETAQPVRPQEPMERVNEVGDQRTEDTHEAAHEDETQEPAQPVREQEPMERVNEVGDQIQQGPAAEAQGEQAPRLETDTGITENEKPNAITDDGNVVRVAEDQQQGPAANAAEEAAPSVPTIKMGMDGQRIEDTNPNAITDDGTAARRVGNVTVTEDADGDRTVEAPEGADADLTTTVIMSVKDPEAAAAVAGLVNDGQYQKPFERITRAYDTDGKEIRNLEAEEEARLQTEADVHGAAIAYQMGKNGQNLDGVVNYWLNHGDKDLIDRAFKLGQQQRQATEDATRQKTIDIARRHGFASVYDENAEGRFRNRVVFNSVTHELTQEQDRQLQVLEEVGYRYGLQFNVYDSLGDMNARYNGDTHAIDIALDADDGAIVRAASHEVYHYIEQFNAEGAERIAQAVIDYLGRSSEYSVADRLAAIARRYARGGQEVNARSELVADSMLDMLANDRTIYQGIGAAEVARGNTDMTSIGRHIQDMAAWLKSTIQKVTRHSPEARALYNQQEYIQTVGDMLVREAREATARRREMSYGLSSTLRGNELVESYFNVVGRGQGWEQQHRNAQQVAYGAFSQAYGKDYMQRWMEENGITRSEAEEQIEAILQEYTDGNKSLNKALQDAGFEAVDEGTGRDLMIFAGRQLERTRNRQDLQETRAPENPAAKASLKNADEYTQEEAEESQRIAEQAYAYYGKSKPWQDMVLRKIWQITKRGIRYNGYGTNIGTINAGQYDVDAIAAEIRQTYPEMKLGENKLKEMIRDLYAQMEESLTSDEGFDAMEDNYNTAVAIAEQIANKAGYDANYQNRDYLEATPVGEWLGEHKGAKIYLDPDNYSEARQRYGGIWQLNAAYRGYVSFTTNKKNANLHIEDQQGENPLLFSGTQSGSQFDDLDDAFRAYKSAKDQVDMRYNQMDRDTFVQDVATRIFWGWFNAQDGAVGQVMKAGSQTDAQKAYKQSVKEIARRYHEKEQQLAKEYEQQRKADEKEAERKLREGLEEGRREYERAVDAENKAYDEKLRAQHEQNLNDRIEIEKARAEVAAQLESVTEQLEKAFDEYKEAERQEYEKREAKLRQQLKASANEKAQKELARRVERMKDSMRRTQLQNRADSVYRKLADRLLHPTNDRNVQEDLRYGVAKALGMLEPGGYEGSRRTMQFNALRSAVQNIVNEDGAMVIPDPDLDAKIQELAELAEGKTIRSMDTNTIEQVVEVMETIHKMVAEAGESISIAKGEQLRQLESEMKDKAEHVDQEKIHNRMTRAFDAQVQGNLMDPVRFFSRMGRECGDIGQSIWKALRKSLDRQITDTDQAEKAFADALRPYKDYWRWTGRNAKTIEAEGIKMTVAQAMTLYKYMQRPDAARHVVGEANSKGEMVGGGIYIDLTDTGKERFKTTRPEKVTITQVNAILAKLTKEQKDCADALGKIMSSWCADLGNEVSMDMYGYKKYKDKNYMPIKIAPGYTSQTMGEDTANVFYMINNQGFTKGLMEHATAPIMLNDIFNLTGQHTLQMITYHAWGREMADIARLMNMKHSTEVEVNEDGRVRTIKKNTGGFAQDMRLLMGDNAMPYFKQLIKDINQLSKDSIERGAMQNFMSQYKGAAVSFNLSTAAKQPLSFVRAFDVIPARYWAGVAGKAAGIVSVRQNIQELQEHSPIYSWKQRGNFVLDAGRSYWDILFPETRRHGPEKVRNKASDIGMWLPGVMDNWTWANIWDAAKRMTERQHRDLTKGSAEYWNAVNDLFNQCIDRTQVVDSILHRTQIMRSQTQYIKMITSFMGEPLKTLNCFLDKLDAFRTNPKSKKAAGALVRTGAILTASNALQAVVASIVGSLRKMGDAEDWLHDFLKRLLGDYEGKDTMEQVGEAIFGSNLGSELNPLNQVPFVRDILEVVQGYDPDRSDLTVVSELVKAGQAFAKSPDSKKTPIQTGANFLAAIANLVGLPVGNVLREAEYLTNWVPKVLEQVGMDTMAVQYWRKRYELDINYTAQKTVVKEYLGLAREAKNKGKPELAEQILGDLQNVGWSRDELNTMGAETTAKDLLGEGEGANKAGYYTSWAAYEAAGNTEKAKEMLEAIGILKSDSEDVAKNQALFLTANQYGIKIDSLNTAQTSVFDAWAEAEAKGDDKTAKGIVNMLINHGFPQDKISTLQKNAQKRRKEK